MTIPFDRRPLRMSAPCSAARKAPMVVFVLLVALSCSAAAEISSETSMSSSSSSSLSSSWSRSDEATSRGSDPLLLLPPCILRGGEGDVVRVGRTDRAGAATRRPPVAGDVLPGSGAYLLSSGGSRRGEGGVVEDEDGAPRCRPPRWTLSSSTLLDDRHKNGEGDGRTKATKVFEVPATVPGDVLTDLQDASVIGDPYYETDFKNYSRLVRYNDWTYSTEFALPPPPPPSSPAPAEETGEGGGGSSSSAAIVSYLLVFDGIKMGASIEFNGRALGVAADQFLRYEFPLSADDVNVLGGGGAGGTKDDDDMNVLRVTFPGDRRGVEEGKKGRGGCEEGRGDGGGGGAEGGGEGAIDTEGRYMACTGGWDWAPYTDTYEHSTGARTFTLGIWKHVYLVPVRTAAILHVVPQVFYRGAYPTEPLREGAHGGFDADVRVHLYLADGRGGGGGGVVRAKGSWGGPGSEAEARVEASPAASPSPPEEEGESRGGLFVSVAAGAERNVTLSLNAPADRIRLWWPAGTGVGRNQPLYDIAVTFLPDASVATGIDDGGTSSAATTATATATASRSIGFRHFALVTGNDTDPSYVRNASDPTSPASEGSSSHGMFFRINGVPLYSRGANVIPMEQMEGRLSDAAHTRMVRSAAEANMNTLRVWGGGIFLPDSFYDACDDMGILVYHDMQYAQEGHAPKKTAVQEAELRHQVRRLSSHPSVVLWDGCNECPVEMDKPSAIYATFVMTVVAEEDKSRAIWPSCPSMGWKTGAHALTSLPNGNVLTTPSRDQRPNHTIETHGPYLHGSGFPAVNGVSDLVPLTPNVPIHFASNVPTGVAQPNVYASEFGAVSMSSFESMSPTLRPSHRGLHGGGPADNCTGNFERKCAGNNVMAQRNYPCDNLIEAYFGDEKWDAEETGEDAFRRQLYMCTLSQALHMKGDVETRRASNQLGTLVWQLNEIWPTGGWGSLEYGPSCNRTKGQVPGGRWKSLHYMYRSSVFSDVMAMCGAEGRCYVRSDAPYALDNVRVQLVRVDLTTGDSGVLLEWRDVSFPPGPAAVRWFDVPALRETDATRFAVVSTVTKEKEEEEDDGGRGGGGSGPVPAAKVLSRHVVGLAPPKALQLVRSNVRATVASDKNDDGSVDVVVTADAPAMYVTLTTSAEGRFSDNALFVAPPFSDDPSPAQSSSSSSSSSACSVTVQFLPWRDEEEGKGSDADAKEDVVDLLRRTLRVQDLSMYLAPMPPRLPAAAAAEDEDQTYASAAGLRKEAGAVGFA